MDIIEPTIAQAHAYLLILGGSLLLLDSLPSSINIEETKKCLWLYSK